MISEEIRTSAPLIQVRTSETIIQAEGLQDPAHPKALVQEVPETRTQVHHREDRDRVKPEINLLEDRGPEWDRSQETIIPWVAVHLVRVQVPRTPVREARDQVWAAVTRLREVRQTRSLRVLG